MQLRRNGANPSSSRIARRRDKVKFIRAALSGRVALRPWRMSMPRSEHVARNANVYSPVCLGWRRRARRRPRLGPTWTGSRGTPGGSASNSWASRAGFRHIGQEPLIRSTRNACLFAAHCALTDATAERAKSRERSVLRALSPPRCLSQPPRAHHRRTDIGSPLPRYRVTHHYSDATSGATHMWRLPLDRCRPSSRPCDREATESAGASCVTRGAHTHAHAK